MEPSSPRITHSFGLDSLASELYEATKCVYVLTKGSGERYQLKSNDILLLFSITWMIVLMCSCSNQFCTFGKIAFAAFTATHPRSTMLEEKKDTDVQVYRFTVELPKATRNRDS
jgi:hypothetical protein